MSVIPPSQARASIRKHVMFGVTATILLAGGVGGWAATSEISGAVIGTGSLIVETDIKKVQHPSGGVVSQLLVREGDHVESGDLLVELDETQTRANLKIILKQQNELSAKQARNEADRDDSQQITFPDDLLISDDPDTLSVVAGEKRLFSTLRASREGQKAQFAEQIAQFVEQIGGLNEQISAKDQELKWIERELKGIRELWDQKLIEFRRVTVLERDAARLYGERGVLIASVAQTRGRIAETRLKILQVDQDARSTAGTELAAIRAKMSELAERRVAAEDALKRTQIRAPRSGYVHELSIHTVGGVVLQGVPLMLIVPDADELVAEIRIKPSDIDQIHKGQAVALKFTTFNQRITPVLTGVVNLVSADISQDQKTSASYYTVRLTITDGERKRLGDVQLIAGMPMEAFIRTNSRTAISYLLRPLQEQMERAWRER